MVWPTAATQMAATLDRGNSASPLGSGVGDIARVDEASKYFSRVLR